MARSPGLSYRPAIAADLPACERVWREGLDGYLGPLGFPAVPLENPGLRRLHAHTLATDPDGFWVASQPDGEIVGFASAVTRGPVWFLSMLFVSPDAQARGVGRALLERTLPPPGTTLATTTDSIQPISNALYSSLGIVPRMPAFNLVGRPVAGAGAPRLPDGVHARPTDGQGVEREPELAAELDELDRAVLGFAHPADHAFVRRDSRTGFGYRSERGQLLGYAYASEAGRVGPLAVLERELLAPVLRHVLAAVEPRGASSVWLPGAADDGIVAALRSGLRMEGYPVLVCWSRPFADFARYVPISPGLL